MTDIPADLTQFRVEMQDNGLAHIVFDCADRTMNVFSNKAIHELGALADWLRDSDVKGAVLRSGKDNGFCAGADLTELGVAYEMIVAARREDRFDIAYAHFFPLSHAIRRLETAGKPVAAAIAGVALGGGCELSLGAHYRVLADTPRAVMGLPEFAVGLLPGAGGTQRMTRLVGLEAGLEVLLQGRTYSGQAALDAGLVHEVVELGQEVAAAEAWLLSGKARAVQPWDEADVQPLPHSAIAGPIEQHRARELAATLGHVPAPIAILDCVELGLMQPIDGAIRSEMSVFSWLIQRIEPRNMIRTMFLGKQAYDKAARKEAVPETVVATAAKAALLVEDAVSKAPGLRKAGFGPGGDPVEPVLQRVGRDMWLTSQPELLAALGDLRDFAKSTANAMADGELLQLDHLVAKEGTIPAYLGGISGIAAL